MAVYLNCNAENARPAARAGDSVSCPKHGTVTIVTGSPNTFHNDQPAARVGDKTSCGATIIEGSSSVFINGKPAAYVGCATDHGGKITSGSPTIFIGATNIEPENYEHDQHLILKDQDGQLLDNIPYRLTDPRSEIIVGTTGADGKTTIIEGNSNNMLSCDIAIKEEV